MTRGRPSSNRAPMAHPQLTPSICSSTQSRPPSPAPFPHLPPQSPRMLTLAPCSSTPASPPTKSLNPPRLEPPLWAPPCSPQPDTRPSQEPQSTASASPSNPIQSAPSSSSNSNSLPLLVPLRAIPPPLPLPSPSRCSRGLAPPTTNFSSPSNVKPALRSSCNTARLSCPTPPLAILRSHQELSTLPLLILQ